MARYGRMRATYVLVATTVQLVVSASAGAFRAPDAAVAPARDFDVRGDFARGLPPEHAPRAVSPKQASSLKELKQVAKDLKVRWSALTEAPSRIRGVAKPLSRPTAGSKTAAGLKFLSKHLALFDLTPDDLRDHRVARDYETRHNGVRHLTLQQRVAGIDVFGGLVQINVAADGAVLNVFVEALPEVAASVNTQTPTLAAERALELAATAAGIGRVKVAHAAGLVYFPVRRGRSRLAWDTAVADADTVDVYRTLVDAVDGTVLWRENQTRYAHVLAHGPVFVGDSPIPDTPTGTSVGTVARVDSPFDGTGFFPHDDPHADWWNGSGEAARNVTRSNNVRAKQDGDGDNDDGEGFPPAVMGENFTFPLDLTMAPGTYTNSAVVNLFYWVNRAHDLFYRLGFDEASGNFQVDNFGLGGMAGDPVQADAQDSTEGCNASMGTPGDGTSPRLQTGGCANTVPARDTALDSPTTIHEFTHGVHTRLVNGLTASQGGGMGEGWGDYFGLSMLAQPGDDLTGDYVFNSYDVASPIRREPYSTNQTVFTRTYADIVDGAFCAVAVCSNNPGMPCANDAACGAGNTCVTSGCTFTFQCMPPVTTINQGPCVAEVHNTGELWAEALWLVRANLVWKYGFAAGGTTADQLVVDGMKLAAMAPDFLDMRDAILQADQVDNGGVNQCLLWDGFAKMGLGASAATVGPADINPVEAFDTPVGCTPNVRVNAPLAFGTVCPGAVQTRVLEVFNTGGGELNVTSVTRVAGSADISVDTQPETPLFVGADAHVDFTVRCSPSTFGTKSATIRIVTNDPDQPQLDVIATCAATAPRIGTVIANGGDFGAVCRQDFRDLTLTITNGGGCDLAVQDITSSTAEFVQPGVMTFPLVVHPGDAVAVPIRLAPVTLGSKTGTITIDSDDPATPSKTVAVSGSTPPGDIRVTGSTAFGDVCAGTQAEKTIAICNVGDRCNLTVTGAAFEPPCADFVLVNNPFPAVVSHDSCVDLVIRFAPTAAGPRACTLVVTSDDPDRPTTSLAVTATAPLAMIDVPPDQAFPPTVIQSTGACSSERPFPVSNTGTCPLRITNVVLGGAEGTEFGLAGLPSFPIILDAGHLAGEGDLRISFAPTALDRDRQGTVDVTYVSDPVTGATTTVSRALCGEGVRTGARVLVRAGGVPLPLVESVHISRITGNRNKAIVDSVDSSRNLALQTVTPAAPCPAFQYHKEYGTVSNPTQLLPGSYRVTVSAYVGKKKRQKTVAFDVTTCDFNPTVVVDL